MVLDSSAVVCVLLKEEGYRRIAETIARADAVVIGAPTLVETDIVMTRRMDLGGGSLLAQFMEEERVVVVPFGTRHRNIAAEAFIRYGKGRHPAALNYGDCMTYATAHVAERPLLFVGNDFAKTDIPAAIG